VDWASGRVTDVRKLNNPPFKGSRRAVPSPDGTSVVFMRRDRGYAVRPGWQIPVVQSAEGETQRVYPTALTLRDAPLWYPGNQSLLFPMPPEGAVGDSIGRMWRFVRLDLQTGRFAEVGATSGAGFVRMAGLTDSSLYYLLGGNRIVELDWKTGTNREIYVHTDTAHQITDAAVLGHAERIAIALYGKPAVIALVTPTETQPVRLGEIMANGRPQLAWSADGKSVLASGQLRGKQGIWRLPVDGGEPSRLELDESDITEIRVSENGSLIAFTRSATRPYELWSYHH
jgi:Tol biopolymer transport system component